MKFRYTDFDPAAYGEQRLDQLRKLFLELLMQIGGEVNEALQWLDQIAQRFGLWDGNLDLEKFTEYLMDEGYIEADRNRPGRTPREPGKGGHRERRPMRYTPTRKAERAIRSNAFDELFSQLRQDALGGEHVTPYAGSGGDRLPETRPFIFGDRAQDIDCLGSLSNMLRRHGGDETQMGEEDLQVYEVEQSTSCATVLALDISHSMTLYGEDRITPAKKVALALAELIQSRYKKDSLDVILFGDDAIKVEPRELAFVNNGPYHTNTKAALELAQRILSRKKHANKQVVLITDGKPSAIHEGGKLYINSFGLDARIVNKTIEEAQACRRKGIIITTFMITSDSYLKQFVQRLSEANKGRAYYADLNKLGQFVMMDYVRNRKKQV